MKLLQKALIFLFLAGIYTSAYAAVADLVPVSCGIYNDAGDNGDKKDGEEDGEKAGEAEPDCD